MSPKVLLCDEITSALDPELVNEVLSVVRQLAQDGMTLIMVTHEMRFAREVGDKLVFMHQGKVHETGDPKVLFANPQTVESPTSLARWNSLADQFETALPFKARLPAHHQRIEGQFGVDIDLGGESPPCHRHTCARAIKAWPGNNWPLADSSVLEQTPSRQLARRPGHA